MANETIVISGANRGIGLELTRQALAAGHKVIAGARDPKKSKELSAMAAEAGGKLRVLPLDITSDESVKRFVKDIGVDHIDLLINNAGMYSDRDGKASQVSPEVVMETLSTNAVGTIRVTQALLPLVKKSAHPRIANTASLMGSITDNSGGGSVAYRMSKTALNMYTKTLSVDEPSIAAVALHPGWVKTDMGGDNAPVEPKTSAEGILKIVLKASKKESGKFFNYDGKELPW